MRVVHKLVICKQQLQDDKADLPEAKNVVCKSDTTTNSLNNSLVFLSVVVNIPT